MNHRQKTSINRFDPTGPTDSWTALKETTEDKNGTSGIDKEKWFYNWAVVKRDKRRQRKVRSDPE